MKFSLLKRTFTTNNKSLSLVFGETLKDLTNDNDKSFEGEKKLTNKENTDNIFLNNKNNKNNKLKIYGPESNTLHACEDDV